MIPYVIILNLACVFLFNRESLTRDRPHLGYYRLDLTMPSLLGSSFFFFYFLSPFSRLAAAFEHHYHMPSMITREGREAPRQIRGVLLDLMELGDAVLSFAGGPG